MGNKGIFGEGRTGRKHQTISLSVPFRGVTQCLTGLMRTRLGSRMPTLPGCQSAPQHNTTFCPAQQRVSSGRNTACHIPLAQWSNPSSDTHESSTKFTHFRGASFLPAHRGSFFWVVVSVHLHLHHSKRLLPLAQTRHPCPCLSCLSPSVDICGGDTRCPRPRLGLVFGEVSGNHTAVAAKHFATIQSSQAL